MKNFFPRPFYAASFLASIALILLTHRPVESGSAITSGVRSNSSSNTTAYEVLESYGFPSGLLPDNVVSYELDEDDGSFSLYLEESCKVKIPSSYTVKYSSTITGTIATGSLSDLSGVSVKVLFIWWSISSITVSGSNLVFHVGSISASFAVSNFSENPVCQSSSDHQVS